MITGWLEKVLPCRCVFCNERLTATSLCDRCYAILPWNETFCDRCGQPLTLSSCDGSVCGACQRRPPAYTKARAPLLYSFPVNVALKNLKFRRQTAFAPVLADLMLPLIESDFADCDSLVPVPLHRWRHAKRGFNQAEELCRTLASASGVPVCRNVLRTRATRSQSGLSAAARRRNLTGAFSVQGILEGRRPLIVDDVITTGTTCDHLAATLLDAGVDRVDVLAVARSATMS